MKRLALIVALCLPAGTGMAYDTFELSDPANEIMEDLDKDAEKEAAPKGDENEAWGKWAGWGLGNTACSEYVSYRQGRSKWYWSRLYWLQGFADGARHLQAGDSDGPRLSADLEPESMAAWVEDYCLSNPDVSLAHAGGAYVEEFSVRD